MIIVTCFIVDQNIEVKSQEWNFIVTHFFVFVISTYLFFFTLLQKILKSSTLQRLPNAIFVVSIMQKEQYKN